MGATTPSPGPYPGAAPVEKPGGSRPVPGKPWSGRRLRIWRRLAMGAALAAIVVVLAAMTVRTVREWRMPEAPEPFDVEAFRTETIPDDRNAFVVFAEAKKMLAAESFGGLGIVTWRWGGTGWSQARPEARAWVETNRAALETWRRGTDRPDALPKVAGGSSSPEHLRAREDQRLWGIAAGLEASRLEGAGDFEAAWAWHKARLRGCLLSARGTPFVFRWGLAMHLGQVASAVQSWGDAPGITVPLLRRAIADIEAMEAVLPGASDTLKAEYLLIRSAYDSPEAVHLRADPPAAPPWAPPAPPSLPAREVTLPGPLRPLAWWAEDYVNNEPERSRRATRLLFANWLSQADRRPGSRTKAVSADPLVFDVAPGTTPPRLAPADLAAFVASAKLASIVRGSGATQAVPWTVGFPWQHDRWPAGLDADRRALADLIVAFASRIYEIETGTYPSGPALLVPKILPRLPDGLDPEDSAPGTP